MKGLLVGLLALCSCWANAADRLTVSVDSSSPTFVIRLAANPSTGFKWKLTQYDMKTLKLTDSKYIAAKSELIGASGEMQFTFALIPGQIYPKSTQMIFCYARSWDPDSATSKRVIVKFIGASTKKAASTSTSSKR